MTLTDWFQVAKRKLAASWKFLI